MRSSEKGHPEGGQEKHINTINGSQHPSVTQDDVFGGLADLARWVPFRLKPRPDTPGKSDKIPANGERNLSTSDPTDWMTAEAARARADEWRGLAGIGVVMTGGVRLGDKRLVGMDFDGVDFDRFQPPFQSYTERSPSGTGVRSFLWAPEEWAQRFQDCTDAHPPGCQHAELYIGSAPRFLTITGDILSGLDTIAEATEADLAWLALHLQPAQPDNPAPTPPPLAVGTPLDLTRYTLKPDHQRLLDGASQPEIDRSATLHSLLIHLFDQCSVSRENVLATMLSEPALWQVCLDHRHGDATRAA
ncbi:MAG: hypothetical protein HYZ18_00495, partial [Pseudogulbenkiania sp.]|nr:hypothetical protein [Pseudogulbenkiania sp.]